MFKKGIKVVGRNPLGGKEAKKLKQEFLRSFPHVSEKDFSNLLPSKEGTESLKIAEPTKAAVIVYAGVPIFIETEGRLFPTLYCLWKVESLIRLGFSVPSPVSAYPLRGANLMLPGLKDYSEEFEVLYSGRSLSNSMMSTLSVA